MTTPDLIARIRAAWAEPGSSCRKVAKSVRCSRSTALKYRPDDGYRPDDDSPDRVLRENDDGTAVLALHTDRPVKTLEDALRVAEVDQKVWHVDRWECAQWTVPIGTKPTPITTQQYRVKVFLRRILSRSLQAATDAVFEKLARHAPKYPTPPKVANHPGEPFLCVLGLFDVHFGKLAWGRETGEDYDLKTAESVFRNAVEDMLAESAGRPVTEFLLPIGNDFYHIDNSRNTTHAGTPQDTDGRYAKVIESGELAVIWAVERLMVLGPVRVVWVPGNHDPTTSYHLARTVAAWFRRCDRVSVDCSPSPRKYHRYGTTLLGMTHGNEERHTSLPALMATERPAEWAAAKCREWLLGHQHRSRQFGTRPVDTHDGVTVRVLPSLAGTDAWHHRKGYVSARHAAEVYWYGRDRGYAGHAVVPARA